MIHYAPKGGIYVYGRIKDNHTVLVILNSAITEQTVNMDRFKDLTKKYTIGKDVITSKIVSMDSSITIPEKGEYIFELSY